MVTSDSFRKIVRFLVSLVERSRRNGIHTRQSSRHRLGLRTKEIHMSVEYSLVELRSLRMSLHFTSTIASRIILFHNLSPQHTGSPEFGKLHKIIGRYTEIKFHSFSDFVDRQTFICKGGQPLITPSQSKTKFLRNKRSGIVQHHGIDCQYPESGQLFHRIDNRNSLIGIIGEITAFGQHSLKRIETNRARYFCQIGRSRFEISGHCFGKFHCAFHASGEIQFHILHVDTMQQSFQVFYRNQIFGNLESQRFHTLFQNIQSLYIGFFHIGYLDILTNQPIVVGTSSPHVGIFTGKRIGRTQICYVFGTVHGVNIKPFVSPPYELFVKISSFKVCHDLFFPFLCGHRRELVKQFFFTFCHSCY